MLKEYLKVLILLFSHMDKRVQGRHIRCLDLIGKVYLNKVIDKEANKILILIKILIMIKTMQE